MLTTGEDVEEGEAEGEETEEEGKDEGGPFGALVGGGHPRLPFVRLLLRRVPRNAFWGVADSPCVGTSQDNP